MPSTWKFPFDFLPLKFLVPDTRLFSLTKTVSFLRLKLSKVPFYPYFLPRFTGYYFSLLTIEACYLLFSSLLKVQKFSFVKILFCLLCSQCLVTHMLIHKFQRHLEEDMSSISKKPQHIERREPTMKESIDSPILWGYMNFCTTGVESVEL